MREAKKLKEEDLYEGLLHDNYTIIKQLYEELVPVIHRDIIQNRGTREEAQDHFQEVMLVVSQNVKNGCYQSNNLKGYIRQVARNLWHKKLRKKGIEEGLDEQAENLESDPFNYEQYLNLLAYDQQISAVEESLTHMESPCKEVLTWHYYHKTPLAAIAEHFQWSYAYCKKKVYNCRKHLKSLVEQHNFFKD